MRKLFLSFFFTVFFCFFHQQNNGLIVHAIPTTNINNTRQLQTQSFDNGTIVCIDLADFYYEIVLSVTSFPQHGSCNDQEEAEIAALLQQSIDTELKAIPGTVDTQNKVCDSPINIRRRRRRRRLTESKNGSLPFYHDWRKKKQPSDSTMMRLQSVDDPMPWENGDKKFHRRLLRSFIYVGGGRCLYCFRDNIDQRLLSLANANATKEMMTTATMPSTRNDELYESTMQKFRDRDLLYLSIAKPHHPLPKVADILLCDKYYIRYIYVMGRDQYSESINWINKRGTKLNLTALKTPGQTWDIIGPYAPGERFGVQFDMSHFVRLENNHHKKILDEKNGGKERATVDVPVKQGQIRFSLHAFDWAKNISDPPRDIFLGDDPLIIFINGIKLDVRLMVSHPSAKKDQYHDYMMEGNSFAGIYWRISRWVYPSAYGPEPDVVYDFAIYAPLIVLSHKNQLDIDFIIKPSAQVKRYAITRLRIGLRVVKCGVTDLENSPFQDFQSVVESRLFHRLGMDLARTFKNKEGHCLYNKIPVVNVHLVEKETWRESNPHCG